MNLKSILLALFALFLSTSANAALVSTGWHTSGDNLITQDTSTGLEWLDLTETTNMSYNSVVAQLGSGGLFDGFRVASAAEVVDLWSNWSVDLSGVGMTSVPGYDPGLVSAIQYLGATVNGYWGTSCLGLTNESSLAGYHDDLGAEYWSNYPSRTDYIRSNYYLDADGQAFSDRGVYLVRNVSPVPVPPSFWLFGTGLLGLIGVARRKARS